MRSWTVAPQAVAQSAYAAATPMFEAAGTVATEIRTPTRALDFAVVRLSIPTMPAARAT